MRTRRQAAREEAADWLRSTATSSSFRAGRPNKHRRRQRKYWEVRSVGGWSRRRRIIVGGMGFKWEKEHERLFFEACKQPSIVPLVGKGNRKVLQEAIADHMNQNQPDLALTPVQIKHKYEHFQRLWTSYHIGNTKSKTPRDYSIILEYKDQFNLIFGAVSTSDSMASQSGFLSRSESEPGSLSTQVLRPELESKSGLSRRGAAFHYLYENGCRGNELHSYYSFIEENPHVLEQFFILDSYEERIDFLNFCLKRGDK